MFYKYLILFLLSLFLIIGVTPALSEIPLKDAQQLVQQGESDYRQGNLFAAVNSLEEAVKIFQAQADWPNLAITLTNLGRLQLSLGKPELALANWQQATTISEQLRDHQGKIRNQIYQAEALQQMGFNSPACAMLQSVLTLNTHTCQDLTIQNLAAKYQITSPLQVNAWRSLGNILRLLGKLEESEFLLKQLVNTALDPHPVASRLSLGNTLRARGDLSRDRLAFPNYDYQPWRCQVMEAVSSPLSAEAWDFYQQAQQQYVQAISQSPPGIIKSNAQLNLLNLFLETTSFDNQQLIGIGREKQADNFLGTRLAKAKQLLSEIDLTHLPINQGTIYAQINLAKSQVCLAGLENSPPPWQIIRENLTQVYHQAQSLKNQYLQSYVLGNLGRLSEYRAWWLAHNQGQENLSSVLPLDWCQQAADCRQQALKLTEEALLLAQPAQVPQIAYQWQWQLGRLLSAQGKSEKAIAMYQQASTTLESVRSDLLTLDADVQFSFRDSIEPLYRQFVDLLLNADNFSGTEEDLPAQALKVIDFLRLSELENFLQCSLTPKLQLESVVEQIDPKAAFIYPLILSDRLELIFKLPQQPLAHRATFIQHTEVEKITKQLEDHLRQSRFTEEVKQEASKIYQWIIKPIEQDLENLKQQGKLTTLVFVLDDTLRNLPMSVLYNQGEYLVEKYALAVIPNRLLFDARPRQKQIKVLTAGVSESQIVDGIEFVALPHVPNELGEIQQLADTASEPLLNQTFTEKQLEQKIDSATFPIVHIATHGEFSSNPNETYLLLWGKRVKVKDFEQILQVNNSDTPKGIELLILSACETAQGNRRATLGLAGVAAQARVRTTIASLWNVNDLTTAEFMTRFYERLRDGLTIAEALQQTQHYFLEDIEHRRPYFWAPFVIVGNWL